MVSHFHKPSLAIYCLEGRKLADLQYTLFSIMESNHGKGIYTAFPRLFEKWMLDDISNDHIRRTAIGDINQCRDLSKHVKTLLTNLVAVIFDPEKFSHAMSLHAGYHLAKMFPDVKRYLMTNYNGQAYCQVAKKYPEMVALFNDVLVSGKEGLMKPQKEMYQLAMSRWELKPEEVIYIDDDLANIQVAKEFGFNIVHFTTFESALLSIKSIIKGYTESQ